MTTEQTSVNVLPIDARRAAAARSRTSAVVLLAALSGATDAIGLLALGGAFTSVMTGNMVLLGVSIGTRESVALGVTLAAIAGYACGVLIGARVAGEPQSDDSLWPHRVTRGLLLELTLFAVFAVGWWATGSHPTSDLFAPLIAVNSMALGIQSSVIIRFGVRGLSATYMTGTLTTMLARIAGRHPLATVGRSASLLCGLICGAVAGALTFDQARPIVPALLLALIGAAITVGVHAQRCSTP